MAYRRSTSVISLCRTMGLASKRNIFSSLRHRWPFKLKSHYKKSTCCLRVKVEIPMHCINCYFITCLAYPGGQVFDEYPCCVKRVLASLPSPITPVLPFPVSFHPSIHPFVCPLVGLRPSVYLISLISRPATLSGITAV